MFGLFHSLVKKLLTSARIQTDSISLQEEVSIPMARVRPICPCCHKTPEVASLQAYLYAHFCPVAERILYSNGLLWSTDKEEITRVERSQLVHPSGKASEDRQVPGKVVSLVEKSQRKDRPSTA